MTTCKVSYVVKGSEHPGGIINLERPPEVGEHIQVGDLTLEVQEVVELMPPRREFQYLHATCVLVNNKS
ncbi:MAG: hypothetical protein JW862_04865 [Anaerolineales bacterium]|nr:hypothetical protein [Anaerolineales bacterium]